MIILKEMIFIGPVEDIMFVKESINAPTLTI